jgi:hypothetical protein
MVRLLLLLLRAVRRVHFSRDHLLFSEVDFVVVDVDFRDRQNCPRQQGKSDRLRSPSGVCRMSDQT